MTFFNIILHGVPNGQKVWSSDPIGQANYIEGFYNNSNSNAPANFFQVEARVEGNTRVCYYHYLKYRDIQAKDGRAGSYFGFTLRIDAMCADLPLLFHHMDEVFHTAILNTVLAATPNGYKHLVSDYAERNNELNTLVKEFGMWLNKPRIKELFGTLPQFPGAKQKYGIVNLEDFSAKQAVSDVLSKGFILCLSPEVPRLAYIAEKKQLQDLLNQKDAEYDKRLQQEKKDTEKKISSIRGEKDRLLQQIATLEENKKKLSAKLTAQNVVEGKLEALKKDMEGLLPYLAIYSATNSSHDGKQQEEYPAEQVLVSKSIEKTEDSDNENEKETMSFLPFVKKNVAYFRLLIFFLGMIITFCLGRYLFPYMPSDRDDAVQSLWPSSYPYTKPEVGDGVAEQDSTVKAEKTPSKKADKKHENSENSGKKTNTTNKGSEKSSERDGKSSSAGDGFSNDRSLPK